MQTLNLTECIETLLAHDNYFIITHTRPDGDTICSAAALCSGLRRKGKTAYMYANPEITDTYAPFAAGYVGEAPKNACVIAVDVADITMFPHGWEGKVDLAIDHHPKNPGYAEKTIVDGTLASCGELVMKLVLGMCGTLSKEEANLLYIAVSTDSGCFCYGNTTAETLRAAAHLIDNGAENAMLNKLFFRSYSFARLKLESMVYAGLQSFRDHKINLAVVTLDMMKECGATEDDCDDLASLPGKIRGSVVNIMIRELEEGKCKVSLRTNDQVDSSEICGRFGGGGHKMAAGCTLNTDPEIAALLMMAAVNDVWPE